MCGIVGYIGSGNACNIVVSGLHRLEYRGYDSAGLALCAPENNKILSLKAEGKIASLEEEIAQNSAAALSISLET
jgi:glucosamine--fructose-6-phosphate aminotransferase (isomerizing)